VDEPVAFASRRFGRAELVLGAALVVLTLVAYSRTPFARFVNYDDPDYVTHNLVVLSGLLPENIGWAFTPNVSQLWHPLTWLSLMLDAQMYGGHPAGFHVTNLLLHTANVVLLFVVLRMATGAAYRSALAAGLFAVHPLHVESVAWVTERKDVLSTFFWMLTTFGYLAWLRRPRGHPWQVVLRIGRKSVFVTLWRPSWRRWGAVVVCFALGLMSKAMVVTLPCTLLLLDFWPLGRMRDIGSFWKLVWEKRTLFLLVVVCSVISMYSRGSGLKSGEYLPWGERVQNAVNSYFVYLGQTFWPMDLIPYYPQSRVGFPPLVTAAQVIGLVVLSVVFLGLSRSRPYLAVGWLWYLGTLVPTLGLVQMGTYAHADRYTYVPSIGLNVMLVWGLADLVPAVWRVRALVPVGVTALVVLAGLTWRQTGYWHDSLALWEHALAVGPDNFVLRMNLAAELRERGDLNGVQKQYEAAARVRPDVAQAHEFLGALYEEQGQLGDAEACYREAMKRQPESPRYRQKLSDVLRRQGREAEARAVSE
jgi:protein O-mannosyl-transferase